MTDFMEIDARWGFWTPSAAEKAHFTASRETVEWLCSQRDGKADPQMSAAYSALAQKAVEVHAEAAEPPLTTVETDMARSIAMFDLEGWKDHDHAEDWMATGGRIGARAAIVSFADTIDETNLFTQGVTVSTHPVAVLMGRTGHDCYPNYAFAVTEPSVADWLCANRAALHEPPYVAPISIRECVEEAEIVRDRSSEVAPLVITMTDALANEFRAWFPDLIATFVPFGVAAAADGTDTPLAVARIIGPEVKNG